MANPANTGHLIGRVAKGGLHPFSNSDGSISLRFSLAVDEDFIRQGKNEPDTDFIPVRVFIPANASQGAKQAWANVHEGDLIAIGYRLSYKPYEKNGKTVYPDGPTVEVDGFPRYLEPKSVTSARAAKKQQAAQGGQVAQQGQMVQPNQAAPAPVQFQQQQATPAQGQQMNIGDFLPLN